MLQWPGKRWISFSSILSTQSPSTNKQKASHFGQKYFDLYSVFFENDGTHVGLISQKERERLQRHGITILNKLDSHHPQLTSIVEVGRKGHTIIYQVRLGWLVMDITLLNISKGYQDERSAIVGGSFGKIAYGWAGETPCIIKIITLKGQITYLKGAGDLQWTFRSYKEGIEQVVTEYAFNLVCSALDIGPKVRLSRTFDLMCYDNKIQFLMEKCQPVSSRLESCSLLHLQRRLKQCVRLLHRFNIVHRDIKPANIVYSPLVNNFVLIDFGITKVVWEKPGFLSTCYREGTAKFMSPELKMLKSGMAGRVDLFWNDAYALHITMIEFTREFELKSACQEKSVLQPSRLNDQAIELVYSIFRNKREPETAQKIVEYAQSVFGAGFPELLPQWNPQNYCDPKYEAELIVRCMGFTQEVLHMLEQNRQKNQADTELMEYLSKLYSSIKTAGDGESSSAVCQYPPHQVQIAELKLLIANIESVSDKRDLERKMLSYLIVKADSQLQRGSFKDLVVTLKELSIYEQSVSNKSICEWLAAVVEGSSTFQAVQPWEVCKQCPAAMIQAIAIYYWSGNSAQAATLLEILIDFLQITQSSKCSLAERIDSVLRTSSDIGLEQYEVLLAIFMHSLAKQIDWEAVLTHCGCLLASNTVPRVILACVNYHHGCALYLLKYYSGALAAFLKALSLLMQQPHTDSIQVAVIQLYAAKCHFELNENEVAATLAEESLSVLASAGACVSEHYFQTVALLSRIHHRNNSHAKVVSHTYLLGALLNNASCWQYYESQLCTYLDLLYNQYTHLMLRQSAIIMISLAQNELSSKHLQGDILIPSLEERASHILNACILCEKISSEDSLLIIVQNTVNSLTNRISSENILHREEVITILRKIKTQPHFASEFICLCAVLLFKHSLLLEHQPFRQVAEILRGDQHLNIQFIRAFNPRLFHLRQMLATKGDNKGISLLLSLYHQSALEKLFMSGLSYRQDGDHPKAQEVLMQLTNLTATEPRTIKLRAHSHFNIALSFQGQDRIEQSMIHFRRAAELYVAGTTIYPVDLAIKVSIVSCFVKIGENRDAMTWFRRISELWQEDIVYFHQGKYVYRLLTTCLLKLGNYRAALWAASRTIKYISKDTLNEDGSTLHSLFAMCHCCCQLKKSRALRRCYSKIGHTSNFGSLQKLKILLSSRSNVLAYSIMGCEPAVGSNLHRFLNDTQKDSQNKPRRLKKILEEVVVIKRILRQLAKDGASRRPSLTERRKSLLEELGTS